MHAPLTRILIKLFSRGFYRANAGLLLFCFVAVVSYTLLMNTAGTMTHEMFEFYQLIIMLTFISSPLAMTMIFIVWLLYTIKSWQYVTTQMKAVENTFLAYSSTSMSKFSQWRSWWWMQFVITLPVLAYGVLSVICGCIFHQYLIPFISLLYSLLLVSLSAVIYVWQANRPADAVSFSTVMTLKWKKPFFSLFLYHMIYKLKTGILLTKAFSVFCLASGMYAIFGTNRQDLRGAALILLTAIASHIYLLYQEHRFEVMTLSFSRNFPYSRNRLFLYNVLRYLLLLSPEIILLFCIQPIPAASLLLMYGISTLLLLRGLLYWMGLDMNRYLPVAFVVYIALFMLILYGYIWQVALVNLVLGYGMFYTQYYKLPPLVKGSNRPSPYSSKT